MTQHSVLGRVIGFLDALGIYDVVLPFLLVFTLVYAILERTRVLGTEKVDKEVIPRKNLNAMAAFVIAFMTLASSRLVEALTQFSAQMVLLLFLGVFFLLLVGTFYKEGEPVILEGGWKNTFMWIMFIGIAIVFLSSIKTETGMSWLDVLFDYISQFTTSVEVAAVILIIFVVLIVRYITTGEKTEKKEEKK